MSEPTIVRLGARGSALAIRQTEWVAAELSRRRPEVRYEIVRIKTSGDRIQNRSLAAIGGKGLFVKEIEEALLDGRVDLGVHSMKDLPAVLAPGLAIAAVPPREDPRDVLVSRAGGGFGGLPKAAKVGTSSLRRSAFVRHARPDVTVVPLRGNVDTRLAKWRAGEVDALVLAAAGLRRLATHVPEAEPLTAEEMLPAIGQGALAIEGRIDSRESALAACLADRDAGDAVAAERAFLRGLGGDCTTPVAAHATLLGERLRLEGAITDPDGRRLLRDSVVGGRAEAEVLGEALARELLAKGGEEILQGLRR